MSVEENKALIRRMYELFNKRELDKYDEDTQSEDF